LGRRMSRPVLAWVAWLLLGLACAMALITLELFRRNGLDLSGASLILVQLLFVALGALIASRQPANAIGWIFTGIGIAGIGGPLAEQYATYAYVTDPGSLVAPWAALWFGEWYWIIWLYLTFVFTALLFPAGHLPSRRWRPAFVLICFASAAFVVMAGLERELELPNTDVTIENPIALLPIDDVEEGLAGGLLALVSVASILVALTALVVRFVRAGGEERQQLKLFTFAGSLLIVGFVANGLLDAIGVGRAEPADLVLFSLMPIAVGMSILRYRLYDIDRIISRTLAYSLVVLMLGLAYVGVVLTIQGVLPIEDDSPLVVAMSTLAVVALFRPVLTRVREVVDRRFNRRSYDARLTLDAFGARLRSEVDLDDLNADLVGVVHRTMQPATVSLWLRSKRGAR
jgi:hypothetical protein